MGVEGALSSKLFGLPLWAWGLIVAGGIAAYYYLPQLLSMVTGSSPTTKPTSAVPAQDVTGGGFIDPQTGMPINFSSPVDPNLVPGLGSYVPSGAGAYQPPGISATTTAQPTTQPVTQPTTQPVTRTCPKDMHPCGKMGAPNNGCCCNKPRWINHGTHCAKK